MKRRFRNLRRLAMIAALGTGLFTMGCNRQPDPSSASADVSAITNAEDKASEPGKIDAVAVVENTAADAITARSKGFDSKSFVGGFTGILPCASCPGIETTIEFKADGYYNLSEAHMGEGKGPQNADGTWTVEEDGKVVRLDPSDRAEPDRVYAIVSKDEITMLDSGGNPAESRLDYSLKRTASKK